MVTERRARDDREQATAPERRRAQPAAPTVDEDLEPWLERGFTWKDGERLVRFGPGSAHGVEEMLAAGGLAPFALVTTARHAAALPALAAAAVTVVEVDRGQVPAVAQRVDAALSGLLEAAAQSQPAGAAPNRERLPALVALGGGRVVDAAKAVAVARGLPLAALPTTLSGAEMTPNHRPMANGRGAEPLRPRLVITDPALLASLPTTTLTASAMNAFGHAMEALYLPLANPVVSDAALRAAALLMRGLERPSATSSLALGGLLAGYAIGATGLGLHHVVSQTIVRLTEAPHAVVNAVMVPHTFRFMLPRASVELAPLTRLLTGGVGAGDATARVAQLAAGAGARRLADLGVREADLPGIAAAALARRELAAMPPSPPTGDEMLALLHSAL
jgi:maleylacetate reductase